MAKAMAYLLGQVPAGAWVGALILCASREGRGSFEAVAYSCSGGRRRVSREEGTENQGKCECMKRNRKKG